MLLRLSVLFGNGWLGRVSSGVTVALIVLLVGGAMSFLRKLFKKIYNEKSNI